jgi:16S rRNA (guanine527-N7)-methyltransferase
MPRFSTITSPDNPRFKVWRELLTGKGLRRHGLALLSGGRQVPEALAKHPELAVALLFSDVGPPPDAAIDGFQLKDALFQQLDAAGTGAPILLLKVPPMLPWSPVDPWPPGCTLLVGFQNPENIGGVIRSAAAFGVAQVVLLSEASHPFLPKSSRGAGPALLDVSLRHGPSIRALAPGPVPLIALDAGGDDLEAQPFPTTFGLLVGLEGPGLPSELRKGGCRSIPMEPGQESLNGATAVAIALYAWRRSLSPPRRAAGPSP